MSAFIELGLFTAKLLIVAIFIILILVVFFSLIAKSKQKTKGRLTIKNLNEKYEEEAENILAVSLNKKLFKKFQKTKRHELKAKQKAEDEHSPHVYVLNFHGDLKASAVTGLREEINAILHVATPDDEVVVNVESAGGMVHAYGLAAAQLLRIREHNIPLTITVDKVAASGGYLMACVANKILAAPFAIIGSIGVIVQLPNFHRKLKENHIDFEQLTAGEYKRTLTVFGHNTEEGREKLQHEIDDIHRVFKQVIEEHRPGIEINKVATGEHWIGKQALELKLIDEIKTSDEYLFERSHDARVFEISYECKKPFLQKLTSSAAVLAERWLPYY